MSAPNEIHEVIIYPTEIEAARAKIRRRRVVRARQVATEACRRASICGEFLRRVRGETGLETLKAVRPTSPQSLVIMLTAYGTVQDAVEAMKLGAYDFVIKQWQMGG